MEQSKIDEIDEYSEQLTEVLDKVPSWFERWGTTFMAAALVILIVLCGLVRYPDVVQATVTITTNTPPARVVAKSAGKLTHLFVQDNALVAAGQNLGVIENAANHEDVLFVEEIVSQFKLESTSLPGKKLELGTVQDAYTAFKEAVNNYRLQVSLNPQIKEVFAIRNQIAENELLLKNQEAQRDLFAEEIKFIEADFARNKKLHEEKVISNKDFEEEQRKFIQQKRSFENTKASILNTQIAIADLKRSLEKLVILNSESINKLQLQAENKLEKLRTAILEWKQAYLLSSSIDGKITFLNYWSVNQHIEQGLPIFTIVPVKSDSLIGKVLMPVTNSGKVKEGQQVNIHLNNFPYVEYGSIRGSVKRISLVPQNGNYTIEVSFPQGLTTTYKKQLEFRQEMQGVAEIITEDMSLLTRIFYQIRRMLND